MAYEWFTNSFCVVVCEIQNPLMEWLIDMWMNASVF
jgi:hypothetical protein